MPKRSMQRGNMNELALFAGVGGGLLGSKLLGWETVCAVENDAFCRGVLLSRQNDNVLDRFPIWDDVRTFDGLPWRGLVDVVSGGFPCQDISSAGKGLGIAGPKSGLWRQFARIIGEVAPPFVLIENSSVLVSRGLETVLEDLDHLGYDAKWGDIRAEDAIWSQGTPVLDHERKRLWIRCTRRLATAPGDGDGDGDGLQAGQLSSGRKQKKPMSGESNPPSADQQSKRCGQVEQPDSGEEALIRQFNPSSESTPPGWWSAEPNVDRVVHGIPNRVDRLRGIGNGQVPAVVKLAWETLTK